MQVCSLPPAWGYEHQGLERFILSFPAGPGRHGSGPRFGSRLIRQEADKALWRRARRRGGPLGLLVWPHQARKSRPGAAALPQLACKHLARCSPCCCAQRDTAPVHTNVGLHQVCMQWTQM